MSSPTDSDQLRQLRDHARHVLAALIAARRRLDQLADGERGRDAHKRP